MGCNAGAKCAIPLKVKGSESDGYATPDGGVVVWVQWILRHIVEQGQSSAQPIGQAPVVSATHPDHAGPIGTGGVDLPHVWQVDLFKFDVSEDAGEEPVTGKDVPPIDGVVHVAGDALESLEVIGNASSGEQVFIDPVAQLRRSTDERVGPELEGSGSPEGEPFLEAAFVHLAVVYARDFSFPLVRIKPPVALAHCVRACEKKGKQKQSQTGHAPKIGRYLRCHARRLGNLSQRR